MSRLSDLLYCISGIAQTVENWNSYRDFVRFGDASLQCRDGESVQKLEVPLGNFAVHLGKGGVIPRVADQRHRIHCARLNYIDR